MPGSNEYSLARASLGYDTDGNNIEISGLNKKSTTNESGGIIPGVGAIGAAIINAISQGITNKQNRDFAVKQARLQNQWNIEQWNRENAYNTPAAQMQRYIDAGLNPNLIVGQQNLAASSPQLVSGKDAPAGVAPQLPVDLPLQAAQIRNLDTNTELQEKSSEKTDAEIKAIFKGIEVSNADIAQMRAVVDLYSHQSKNLDALADYYSQYTKNLSVEERAANLKYLLDDTLFNTYVEQAKSSLELNQKQAETFVKTALAMAAKDYASANYLNSEAKLNDPYSGVKWRLLRAQGDAEWSSSSYWGTMANLIRDKGSSLISAKIAYLYGQIGYKFVEGLNMFLPSPSLEQTTQTEKRGPNGKTTTKTTKTTQPKGRGFGRGFARFLNGLLKYSSKAVKM